MNGVEQELIRQAGVELLGKLLEAQPQQAFQEAGDASAAPLAQAIQMVGPAVFGADADQ